jgi:hypothetical protein
LGDPWAKGCFGTGCCTNWTNQAQYHNITTSPKCIAPWNLNNWSWDQTTYYMGPIHARPKRLVAERLAAGAFNSVYGGAGALSGPVISGCLMHADGKSVELSFNKALLKGDSVSVQPYNKSISMLASAMQVYTNGTLPADGWHPETHPDGKQEWAYVDITLKDSTTVVVDLSQLPNGTAIGGLRYAWEGSWGCGSTSEAQSLMNLRPCPMNSHPIVATASRLPAMPFILRVEAGGKCGCVAPQKC